LALDLIVERPVDHQSLSVAVSRPGSGGRHFAYSSKQLAMPARGTYAVNGRPRALAPGALACQDWGRGVWPHRTAWNWACACGVQGARALALNLGARWTDGGGATENAIFVDGKISKLGGEVKFDFDPHVPRAPWRIRGDEVELTVTPEAIDDVRLPGLGRLCLAF